MKNKIIYLLALGAMLASCDFKEDYYYDQSPDDRLNEVLTLYGNTLTSSPNGWFLNVNTGAKGGYRHWMSFTADNRVSMLSDMDATHAGFNTSQTPKESSWHLSADQAPILIFDTYNYLHMLADPVGKDRTEQLGNGGANGEGLISDFEFYIRGVTNGSLNMLGRFNRCVTSMEPASAEEARAAMYGGLKTAQEKTNAFLESKEYIIGKVGGTDVEFSLATRQVTAAYMSGGKLTTAYSGAYPDLGCAIDPSQASSSIKLLSPFPIKGKTITAFDWDGTRYNIVLDDHELIPLEFSASTPLPLNLGYHKDFSILHLSKSLPGTQDAGFLTNIYNASMDNWAVKRAPRVMSSMRLYFDADEASNNLPILKLEFKYTSGASNFTGVWRYKFTDNEDGTITITDRDQNGSSNEYSNESYIKTLLNYFCYVPYTTEGGSLAYANWVKDTAGIVAKKFRIEWAKNRTPGSAVSVGSLTPVANGTDPSFVSYRCIGQIE